MESNRTLKITQYSHSQLYTGYFLETKEKAWMEGEDLYEVLYYLTISLSQMTSQLLWSKILF